MSPADVRSIALSLNGVRETGEPGRPAWAVRGKVFAVLWTPERLFVEGAGMVELASADPVVVRESLRAAWEEAAPRAIRRSA